MMRQIGYRRILMTFGFVAAGAGDWFLAVKGSPVRSSGFLAGICCFVVAHAFWTAGQIKEARPDARVFAAAAIPLMIFTCLRLVPVLPPNISAAIVAYAAISALSLSVAVGGRRLFYTLGIFLLAVSDVMIGARMLHAPGWSHLVGPFYIAAEILLCVSCIRPREPRLSLTQRPLAVTMAFGAVAAASFSMAMATFPGGGYNPLVKMLSVLGRTAANGVKWPACHYLFIAGMVASAAGASTAMLSRRHLVGEKRRRVLDWGASLNAAGLLTIAAMPENVNMAFHNAGCWLAAIGGGMALFSLDRKAASCAWTILLVSVVCAFCAILLLNAMKVVPFSPAVTAMQKVLILSFAAWVFRLVWPSGSVNR